MGKNRRTIASGKVKRSRILTGRDQAKAIAAAAAASGMISVLFYNSPWGMCTFPAAVFLSGRFVYHNRERKRQKRLNLEFKDYMYAVSSALSAGYSIERAFLAGLKDMERLYKEESVLKKELEDMEKRLSLQEPIEHILSEFAAESKSEDIETFAEVFCFAKRGGGNFIHIIEVSVGRLCDKIEVQEEIQSVMAEKKLEQKIMCAAPLFILLFFKAASPEFIGALYGNLLGVLVMTTALLLYCGAFFLGMKIMEVDI